MLKKGFTLVEVSLFLALSGLLVASVIAGTSQAIASKRYNDTIDNFADYLENLYADVSYVRHNSSGQTDQAVYGKLINIVTEKDPKYNTTTKTFTIIGDANTSTVFGDDALDLLLKLHPELTKSSEDDYSLSWSGWAKFQKNECAKTVGDNCDMTDDGQIKLVDENRQVILLIIRHPKTGAYATYAYYPPSGSSVTITADETDPTTLIITRSDVGKIEINADDNGFMGNSIGKPNGNFIRQDVNFCVNSPDKWAGGNERRLIRIHEGANNASGVEIIGNDQREGMCEGEGEY